MNQSSSKSQTSEFLFICRFFLIPLYSLFILGFGCGLYEVLTDEQFYNDLNQGRYSEGPFAPYWYFTSAPLYILDTSLVFIWILVGFFLCIIKRPLPQKIMPVHGLLTIIYWFWLMNLE